MPDQAAKTNEPENVFTYDEYIAAYAMKSEDDNRGIDDPEAVGNRIADQALEILRTALAEK